MTTIKYRRADLDGLQVFYREAGRADGAPLLLLHGFPSASHMFRDLIPQLANEFHIIAPDLPGFGRSDMPSRENSITPSKILRGNRPVGSGSARRERMGRIQSRDPQGRCAP